LPIGMTLFGLIVLLGPLLGPVLGGWLTEHASWRWCFFINVPVCAALLTLLLLGLPRERTHLGEVFDADWLGITGLAMGLSTLTVVLEEGQREQWFESSMIVTLSIISAIGMAMVALSQFTAAKPILRLSLLRNKSYASVIFIVFTIGAGLYGVSYLVPQFLSLISGYNAEQSGSIMLLSGVPAFLMMPVIPRLLGRVDSRILVISGLLCFALSCMLDIHLTAQSVGHDFTASQLLRGVGQMLCMFPLNQASMAAVTREESGDAAGIYNMARNLGGSVGLAVIGSFIDRRNSMHVSRLNETLDANSTLVQEHVTASTALHFSQTGDFALAKLQALKEIALQIQQQASVMTFSETFYVLGVALLLCIPLALVLKTPTLVPAPASTKAH
jgi:DHA2 family multidrug resistance protein